MCHDWMDKISKESKKEPRCQRTVWREWMLHQSLQREKKNGIKKGLMTWQWVRFLGLMQLCSKSTCMTQLLMLLFCLFVCLFLFCFCLLFCLLSFFLLLFVFFLLHTVFDVSQWIAELNVFCFVLFCFSFVLFFVFVLCFCLCLFLFLFLFCVCLFVCFWGFLFLFLFLYD